MFETRISAYGTFVILVLLLTGSVTTGSAQSLYDNFKAPKISPDKWVGGEGASLLGLETTRAIENGQLRLRNRSVGFTASDSGFGTNFVFLGLPDPEATGDMKATVTVTGVNDVGCIGNTTPTLSFAGLIGSFFNAGTPTNGDATNDIVAAVGISSDSDRIAAGKRPQVVSYVLQCTNQSCDTFTVLDFNKLRSIVLGTQATVELVWGSFPPLANQNFSFKESEPGKPTVTHVYSYAGVLTDTSSPGIPFKHLQAQNNVANCTTAPRPVADISALYDNVNPAPTSTCPPGFCCVGPSVTCSSNQDCCAVIDDGAVECGGQGSPHCCLSSGSSCADGDILCCSGRCDVTDTHCL